MARKHWIAASAVVLMTCAGAEYASGEVISFGVKGGFPLTDAFEVASGNNSAYFTKTKRYTFGLTFELHLPARFSIEVDALYRRLGYENQVITPLAFSSTRANAWEFPVLGKFEITPGPLRPFIDAGANFRHISGVKQVRQVVSGATFSQVEINNPAEFNKDTDIGFTFGAGLALKIGPVRISPELRFTHWGSDNFRDPVNSLLHTNRNDGTFLLGFTF